MIDDLKRRWLELASKPSSRLTYTEVEEQFNLAQALTSLLDPILYENLNAHRAECLKLLRESRLKVPRPELTHLNLGEYNALTLRKHRKHKSWRDVELTPDITWTVSDELVGKVIPANYTKALRKMIQLQGKLLLQLEDK
jgi:hypothetical protein